MGDSFFVLLFWVVYLKVDHFGIAFVRVYYAGIDLFRDFDFFIFVGLFLLLLHT